jgi:HD-like signal output (HDOD) protein
MAHPKIRQPHFASWDLAVQCEEVVRLSSDAEPNLQEIARRAQAHPALAQLVVTHVNSPRYGLRNKVSDVHHAVALLGAERIRGLVEQLLQDTQRLQALARESRR